MTTDSAHSEGVASAAERAPASSIAPASLPLSDAARVVNAILDEVCRRSRRTRSEVMREALRRHLAQQRFEQLRRRVMPFAEARGYLADDDVFRIV